MSRMWLQARAKQRDQPPGDLSSPLREPGTPPQACVPTLSKREGIHRVLSGNMRCANRGCGHVFDPKAELTEEPDG